MDFREKQKIEALKRLETLTETLDLNPNIIKYFKEEKLYYSYLTACGMMGSIDTINYIPEYAEIAKQFEKEYGGLVYHAIEDSFGMLCLLYVSEYEDEWSGERPEGKYLYVNTYVFDREKLANGEYEVAYEEMGTIVCDSLDGAIVRVG